MQLPSCQPEAKIYRYSMRIYKYSMRFRVSVLDQSDCSIHYSYYLITIFQSQVQVLIVNTKESPNSLTDQDQLGHEDCGESLPFGRIRVTHHQKCRVLEKLENNHTLARRLPESQPNHHRAAEGTFTRSRERQLRHYDDYFSLREIMPDWCNTI